MDSLGGCGESCVLTLLRVRFAWQVWGMVAIGGAARVLSRDRRGGPCARRAFHAAGAGNRARRVKPLDFVALCEKSRACVSVDECGGAKSWQAQGIR